MGNLTDVREVILSAKKHGVSIRLGKTGQLLLSGPRNSEITEKLKLHKKDILSLLHNTSSNLNEIVNRLRKGQTTLIAMQDKIWDKDGNPIGSHRAVTLFVDAMCRWDILDMMLQGHPNYVDGCPIGEEGCDPDSPVLCRSCEK
jgi:hypothetical protein